MCIGSIAKTTESCTGPSNSRRPPLHVASGHSPCGRSISQACPGDIHQSMKTQPIPTQTLDSQARAQDTHQWHHSASMPAIPHADAPFQKRPRETNISGITASHESPFTPLPHVDARFHSQVRKVNTEVITKTVGEPSPLRTTRYDSLSEIMTKSLPPSQPRDFEQVAKSISHVQCILEVITFVFSPM